MAERVALLSGEATVGRAIRHDQRQDSTTLQSAQPQDLFPSAGKQSKVLL
jgi:hypothetical protein